MTRVVDLAATIFIVDDDEADRCSLAALIESHGFQSRSYASATAFLDDRVASQRGCLLVDVQMPEMGGLLLQRRMREAGMSMPVIVMTAFGDVPTAVQAMKDGAVDFIEKPFREEALLAAVQAALDRDRMTAEHAARIADVRVRRERLTPRERQVLDGLTRGRQNKEIAYDLGISPRTVEIHRARVMEKMEVHNLPQLIRLTLAAGP
ncbi:MAG: response regulator transcription factor [Rhodospirillales bacterium]|nr:response regulator transcription factor [Rhodospirillales bacterium]